MVSDFANKENPHSQYCWYDFFLFFRITVGPQRPSSSKLSRGVCVLVYKVYQIEGIFRLLSVAV